MAKVLRYSAISLVASIVMAGTGLFIITRDEAPPDISDLAPHPLTVSPEENAHLILQKLAAEFCALPKDKAYDAALDRLRDAWSISDATLVVRHADAIWPRFDAITGRAQSEAAPYASGKRYPYISEVNKLWEVAVIRIKYTSETAGPDEALALALTTQKRALHMSDAGGTVIDTLVGIGMYAVTHDKLVAVLTETTPSSAALRQCLHVQEATRMSAAAFAASLKTAFSRMPDEIEDMRRKHGTEEDFLGADFPWGAQWLYKPNQTTRILAEHTRKLIQAIDQPYETIDRLSQSTVSPFLFANVPSPDNAYGKSFIELIPPGYASVLKSRLKVQTRISVTQAWMGVTLFARDHGRLPDSLAQLVPDYLPGVPRDYFTGEVIRYSPTARTVWSGGKNDLVITSADQKISGLEIALKIPPAGNAQ